MSAVVEEDADDVVGQLVPEAVLVRVVHPLGHPQEVQPQVLSGKIVGWQNTEKKAR